jgi:hypothetical protein
MQLRSLAKKLETPQNSSTDFPVLMYSSKALASDVSLQFEH